MKTITIDKNVPMPNFTLTGRPQKYPWDRMEVGDSFVPQCQEKTSAYNIALGASRKLAPKVFKTSRLADGVFRIWRVA